MATPDSATPNPATDELAEMIARVALRDRAAFDALYAAMSPKLFGVLLRLLRQRSEAEDALQEAFIRIWTRADRFTPGRMPAEAWLVTVTRNLAIDRLRARKPESREIDEARAIPDETPGPRQRLEQADDRRRLEGCLEELDAARADAVVSAYIEGYTYQELAERHSVPLNTMRTWLRRSLMKLKECLEA